MKVELAPILFKLSTRSIRENLADQSFTGTVDGLVTSLHEDITQVRIFEGVGDVFYLLLIKLGYIDREHDGVNGICYVAQMLTRFAHRNMVPSEVTNITGIKDIFDPIYPVTLEHQLAKAPKTIRTMTYQFAGDRALFLAGMFPEEREPSSAQEIASEEPRRRKRKLHEMQVEFGQECYDRIAKDGGGNHYMTETYHRLSQTFTFYVELLGDLSKNFLSGPNKTIVQDRMLDAMTRYKAAPEEKTREEIKRYAAILNLTLKDDNPLFKKQE